MTGQVRDQPMPARPRTMAGRQWPGRVLRQSHHKMARLAEPMSERTASDELLANARSQRKSSRLGQTNTLVTEELARLDDSDIDGFGPTSLRGNIGKHIGQVFENDQCHL